mgnify:CR=1 FL=1
MFTSILLPISLFIIIQTYIFTLDIPQTEKILTEDDKRITNYIQLMKNKSDVSILMIILIMIYWFMGGILSLF